MEMTYALTPQERLTMPIVEAIHNLLQSIGIVRLSWGVQSAEFTKEKPAQSSRRSGFLASTIVYRFGVLGGRSILSRSSITSSNCYNYLVTEHGTL